MCLSNFFFGNDTIQKSFDVQKLTDFVKFIIMFYVMSYISCQTIFFDMWSRTCKYMHEYVFMFIVSVHDVLMCQMYYAWKVYVHDINNFGTVKHIHLVYVVCIKTHVIFCDFLNYFWILSYFPDYFEIFYIYMCYVSIST
jgi:hypothetical protein